MELTWCLIVLLVVSFETCLSHPYGVKGGAGSAAGASSGAIAGAGAVSNSGESGAGSGSGSYSGSISKSAASSFAAATSGSFSFSGSGAGPFSGLLPNPFNFPLNGGGCATGKCENGDVRNQFGLSPNSAGSISAAGAGSFALSGAPDSNKQSPCSGNCLNKEPPRCQGYNCNYPPSTEDDSEPNDIPVNIGNNQENEPKEKPCQTGNCKSSPNSESDDNTHNYPPSNNNGDKSPSPYKNPLKPGNPSIGPSYNENSPTPNSNNQDVGSNNEMSPNSYETPHYPLIPPTALDNVGTFSPSINTPSNEPPYSLTCDKGKCQGSYPNSGQEYNPNSPLLPDNAPPCSNGNCGGYAVKNTQPPKPYATPTYQSPTVPNLPFPCTDENCNKLSTSNNYPVNPSSEDEPVYTGGFGGPSGILKPNDYAAALPSNSDQPRDTYQASPSPHFMHNKPGNYNSPPNLNDASSPNSKKPFPHNPYSSLPTDEPIIPPKNGMSPSSYATAQNPSSPSPHQTPVRVPFNEVKSPKPNKNSPAYNQPTEPNKSTPEYNSPDLIGPFSLSPTNALPAPSLLLETPKETFPQMPGNDDLYSPNLPSSYNVPIIPNEDSYKPDSSSNSECNSSKCKSGSQKPSTIAPALSSFPPEPPTKNPACAFGACNKPDEKPHSTTSYANSQGKTPKEPGVPTSTINVQLSTNPTDSSDDAPDFDVRYTTSNCINGNCLEKSSNDDNYSFRNQPKPNLDPNSQPPCQNGNCPVNYPNSATGPSVPHPLTAPPEKYLNNNSPLDSTQPISPSGCLYGKCGESFPNSPIEKPYTSNNSPSNYYPQPSTPGCSNEKCGGNIHGSSVGKPSSPRTPTLNPSIPGCSNGQCVGRFPDSETAIPYNPDIPVLNNYPPPLIPGCSGGQCSGSFPNSQMGNSPSGVYTNNFPQPVPSGCLHGKCGGNIPGFDPSSPNTNEYAEKTPSDCQNGKCAETIPVSNTGSNNNRGRPSMNTYPQTSPSGCANGNCGGSSPVTPTKNEYNPQTLASGLGCANGNCLPTKPCANGKCGAKIPDQPDYTANPSSQNEPIYGGGFGGPSGILKPNEFSAPLPLNPAQAGNPVPRPPSPHYTPNKPVHQNMPILPSSNSPNTYSPTVFDKPQPQDSTNLGNSDHGPQYVQPMPPYPNAHPGQPQIGENIPHSFPAGSVSISGAGAYSGGFGGPPGYLKPFDDDKGVKPKQSGASLNGGSLPPYGSGAFSAAGSYSGGGAKTIEPESTGNPKESGCGGGCPKAGGYGASGSFGVGGSLGLAKGGFDALIGGLSGAAATAKSLAGALAGTGSNGGSHALSGSLAASSAVASSGAYKGGYGR